MVSMPHDTVRITFRSASIPPVAALTSAGFIHPLTGHAFTLPRAMIDMWLCGEPGIRVVEMPRWKAEELGLMPEAAHV